VDISMSPVTDDGIEALTKAVSLDHLSLADCRQITSKGAMRLIQLTPKLRSLNLRGTSITRELFDVFKRPVALRKLNCSKCKRLSSCTLGSKNCLLNELNLSSNIGLKQVELSTPALTSLNLSSCKFLSSLTFTLSSPDLHTANLSGDHNLLEIKGERPTGLRVVNLFQCRTLTPASIAQVCTSAPVTLTRLNCGGLIQLTQTLMSELLIKCPSLLELDLSGCKAIPPHVSLEFHELLDHRKQTVEERVIQRSPLKPSQTFSPSQRFSDQKTPDQKKSRTP